MDETDPPPAAGADDTLEQGSGLNQSLVIRNDGTAEAETIELHVKAEEGGGQEDAGGDDTAAAGVANGRNVSFSAFSSDGEEEKFTARGTRLMSTLVPEDIDDSEITTSYFEGDLDQDFWQKVAHKIGDEGLPHDQAVQEVRIDRLISRHGSVDKALVWVLQECPAQGETIQLLAGLLPRGVDLKSLDVLESLGETALHVVAGRNFYHVAHGLLVYDKEAPVTRRDKSAGLMPVEVALKLGYDEVAALLLKAMNKASVRNLFTPNDQGIAKNNFEELLRCRKMPETCQAVMNACIEPTGEPDELKFYFDILEADRNGAKPCMDSFIFESQTAYHRATENPVKDIRHHPLVRMLTYDKWESYGGKLAAAKLIVYLVFLAIMSFSLVIASEESDPTSYESKADVARAIFEILTVTFVIYQFVDEVVRMKRTRLEYFKFGWNYVRLSSIALLLSIIPLRFTDTDAQWHVASVAFAISWVRLLELISVTKFVGIYMQMLGRILQKDVSRFLVVFGIIVIAYSGSLVLALRGEPWTGSAIPLENRTNPHDTTQLGITLLTDAFGTTLLTGLRTMVQQESIVSYIDDANSVNSFSWLAVLINVIFLFFLLVVLLNILIAQLSDTYAEVQGEARHELEGNWASAITLLEQTGGTFMKNLRFKAYKSSKDIPQAAGILPGLESIINHAENDKKNDDERRRVKMESQLGRQSGKIESLSFQMKKTTDTLRRLETEGFPRVVEHVTHLQNETLPTTVTDAVTHNTDVVTEKIIKSEEKIADTLDKLANELMPDVVERIVSAKLGEHVHPLQDQIDDQQRQIDDLPTRQELTVMLQQLQQSLLDAIQTSHHHPPGAGPPPPGAGPPPPGSGPPPPGSGPPPPGSGPGSPRPRRGSRRSRSGSKAPDPGPDQGVVALSSAAVVGGEVASVRIDQPLQSAPVTIATPENEAGDDATDGAANDIIAVQTSHPAPTTLDSDDITPVQSPEFRGDTPTPSPPPSTPAPAPAADTADDSDLTSEEEDDNDDDDNKSYEEDDERSPTPIGPLFSMQDVGTLPRQSHDSSQLQDEDERFVLLESGDVTAAMFPTSEQRSTPPKPEQAIVQPDDNALPATMTTETQQSAAAATDSDTPGNTTEAAAAAATTNFLPSLKIDGDALMRDALGAFPDYDEEYDSDVGRKVAQVPEKYSSQHQRSVRVVSPSVSETSWLMLGDGAVDGAGASGSLSTTPH